MTKESLIEALNNMPDGEEVLIDVNVRGVEFTIGIEEIFESGTFTFPLTVFLGLKKRPRDGGGTKEV